MSEGAIVHIGENSPEEVAYKLMTLIAGAESRQLYGHGTNPVTREWVLKTYSQCLRVIRGRDSDEALQQYLPESFAAPGRR